MFVAGTVAGCAALWRLGLRWQVALCLSFIPVAYVLAFGFKILPFGGTRHSYFAFPFLFAPPAALGALALGGARRLLGEIGRGTPAGEMASGHGGRRVGAGLIVMACCGLYLFGALRLYAYVVPYYLRQSPQFKERHVYYKADFYKPVETPTRKDDLNLLARAILTHVAPGEIVLASYPSFLILRSHLEPKSGGIPFDLFRSLEFDWNGRRILYIP
jgi:hypothetical protein